MRTGRKQVIDLLSAIDPNNPELEDKKIVQAEEVKTIAKRHLKLKDSLKKRYAMVYDQCLQEVQDKLECVCVNLAFSKRGSLGYPSLSRLTSCPPHLGSCLLELKTI